jgi:hypothetical protein
LRKTLTKAFIVLACLFLIASVIPPLIYGQVEQCFEVKFRGIVISRPDFGGAVGVEAVNVQVESSLSSQSSDLKVGDIVTVFWPIVPRFLNVSAKIGDEAEVYGSCCKDSMPSWWSNTGQYLVGIAADDYYLRATDHSDAPPPWWFWAIIIVGTGAVIGSMVILSRRKPHMESNPQNPEPLIPADKIIKAKAQYSQFPKINGENYGRFQLHRRADAVQKRHP